MIKAAEEAKWNPKLARDNGLPMPGSEDAAEEARRDYFHRGSHQHYTDAVEAELNALEIRAREKRLSKEQIRAEVERIVRERRADIGRDTEESSDPAPERLN